jgi:hypothetical protein
MDLEKQIKDMKHTLIVGILVALFLGACGNAEEQAGQKLIGKWSVKEMEINGTAMQPIILEMLEWQFNEDSTCSFLDAGKTFQGKWKLTEKATKLEIVYSEDGHKSVYDLVSFSDKKIEMKGEDFGQKRFVLAPKGK